nr:MAG TPA: hypothetical protein [Caudoviricetes sp.]
MNANFIKKIKKKGFELRRIFAYRQKDIFLLSIFF